MLDSVARGADTWDNGSGDATWFTPANWADDTVPTSADAVTFPAGLPGGDATIDLSGPAAADAQSLVFSDSYTLTGSAIRVGNGSVTVGMGATARIDGLFLPVTANGLGKTGAGTLVLTTPATASFFASVGGIGVSGGTLRLESGGIISGATVSSGRLELGGITLDRDVTLTSGGGLSGTGTASLTGELHINPSSKYTLTTSGTLTLGDGSNAITGGGNSYGSIEGTGTVVLAQPNTVSTRWALNGGTLQIAADDRLGAATSDLMFGGGTLAVTDTFSSDRPVYLNSEGGTFDVASGKTLTLTKPINGNAGAVLTKTGGGKLVLTAASSRAGDTKLTEFGSTVRVEDGGALGTGTVHLSDFGVMLELGGVTLANDIVAEVSRTRIRGTGISATTGVITAPPGGSALEIAAIGSDGVLTIGDGPGDLISTTSSTNILVGPPSTLVGGTVVLPYANTGYSGGWSVSNGTLRVGDPLALGSGTTSLGVFSGGTLELADVTLARDVSLFNGAALRGTGAAGVTGAITVAGGVGGPVTVSLGAAAEGDVLSIGDAPNDLTGGSASATLRVTGAGTVRLLQPSNVVGQWIVDGATLRLDAADALGSASNPLTVSAGVTQVNATQHVSTLTVNDGALAAMGAGGGKTLVLGQLALASAGKLDVSDNAVILRDAPAGSWDGAAYTGAAGEIQRGRHGGTWDGAGGIVTTDPSAAAAAGLGSLGIATAGEILNLPAGATAMWRGETVTADDTLIAFTYAGDANLDGKINIDDYGRIDSNVGRNGSVFGWFNGDFNYDGKINIDDYGIIDSNIGIQGPPLGAAAGALTGDIVAVPEPGVGAGAIMALGAGWGGRRKRRGRSAVR
jgi:hypothetical protein